MGNNDQHPTTDRKTALDLGHRASRGGHAQTTNAAGGARGAAGRSNHQMDSSAQKVRGARPRTSAPAGATRFQPGINKTSYRRRSFPSRITPAIFSNRGGGKSNAARFGSDTSTGEEGEDSDEYSSSSESSSEVGDELELSGNVTLADEQDAYNLIRHLKNGPLLERYQDKANAVAESYDIALSDAKRLLIDAVADLTLPRLMENFSRIAIAAESTEIDHEHHKEELTARVSEIQGEAEEILAILQRVEGELLDSRQVAKAEIQASADQTSTTLENLRKSFEASQSASMKKLQLSRSSSGHADKKRKKSSR